ncbi:MAG: nitroreductase family protein [Muribaculaceae bacterium]|nr:nitroreductase family protein [Muribaculaceae bacterium]
MEYFKNRKTIRNYSAEHISDLEIDEMLAAAAHAPTCGGMQLYNVIVTRSEEGKSALAPAHFNQPCLAGASAVLTFCADFNRVSRWARERGAEPGFDNLQSFISAMLDATILAQQFVTIAEMRGYGTCYLGTTTWNAPQIIEALGLPELVIPVITVTLGVPTGHLVDIQPRLPLDAIRSREKYEPVNIDSAYSELESREDSRRFMKENRKDSLAAVFTDVRYPKAGNEHFSEILMTVLHQQGFLK